MSARFWNMIPRTQVDVIGGPSQGREYSLGSACSTCGSGARAVGPMILPRFAPPAAGIFSTLDREVLLSSATVALLRKAGIGSLGPVLEKGSHRPMNVSELLASATLPRFSATTSGYERERPCPSCDRDGYFGVPHEPICLVYDALDVEYLGKDVVQTFELFGNSCLRSPLADSVFAAPLYLVSTRFADLLRQQPGMNVDFAPVEIKGVS